MSRLLLPLICVGVSSSCSFYDYPSQTLVAKKGDKVLHYSIRSVEPNGVKLKGSLGGEIPLRVDEELSAGNNQHLKLLSTDVKHGQATFEHRWLEWHGGLELPPF